jgi:hypothetical protein
VQIIAPRRSQDEALNRHIHPWFEQRAAKRCLVAFIDDATGLVLGARFFPVESTCAYLQVLWQHVSDHQSIFTKQDSKIPNRRRFGRKLCIHSRFSRPKKPSQAALSGEHPLRDIERISFALCTRPNSTFSSQRAASGTRARA